MIRETLINLKSSMVGKISQNELKIAGAMTTIPFIAASNMSGACASGCPYGLVNDPFPGQCSRFTDLNGDGICDLSQTVTTTSVTTDTTSSSSTTDSSSSTQDVDTSTSDISEAHNGNSNISDTSTAQDPSTSGLDSSSTTIDGNDYHLLPITLLIIGGYLFTYYLFKKGILKRQQHKRIWNLLLMIGYLGTGLTGIMLTLIINIGISTIYNSGITYWHAELSILMVIGTLVHLHIYKKPFKNMFKVLFGFKINSKKKNDLNL
ncbi:hypothetical protein [Methanobacterium oryzae]|uniref:hypothetical protein n=1 Tax=Methanobacterium oryzae TaxID=69540 RepID=UPI003D22FEBD